ncbi:hypothetical protein HY522_01145 [bacterium]|nr:hypothetical protein [bacterium]
MRKRIWASSGFAFVPVVAGLLAVPVLGSKGWWSLAAGGAFAALAFGSFLEIAGAITGFQGWRTVAPVVLPVAALLAVGFLGAVSLDLVTRSLLRPETFVSGILAGTLFSQFALMVSAQSAASIRE